MGAGLLSALNNESQTLLSQSRLFIVDTSLISKKINLPEDFHRFQHQSQIQAVRTANDYCNQLISLLKFPYVIPPETVKELLNSHNYFVELSNRFDNVLDLGVGLNGYIVTRKRLSENFSNNSTLQYIHEIDWEEGILQALKKVVNMKGISIDYSKKHGGNKSLKENKYNDAKIFAQAYAISYYRPVSILTADSDFIRIQRRFYNLEGSSIQYSDSLSKKFNFRMPEDFVVDIVFYSPKNERILFRPDGKYTKLNKT